MNILLRGVVGSTAYGLAGPDSDVDRLGLFAYDTIDLLGLNEPQASIVSHEPDITLHEAAKYAKLAMACNPTVLELMWLEDYEVVNPLGAELIDIRSAFLSRKRVRDAYLGYATQQFRRLEMRQDGSFSADTRKRTAKHARHLMRLCHQGLVLYATGRLVIKLEDPEGFRRFGDDVADGDTALGAAMLRSYEERFNAMTSVLPDEPQKNPVEAWLKQVRRHYWTSD